MHKATLRPQLLAVRKAMSERTYRTKSQALCARLQTLISTASPQAIHSFLPMYAQREPDIMPLLRAFCERMPIYTSITEHAHLRHVRFCADTQLRSGPWGIPTPVDALEISIHRLQNMPQLWVLVPLLAFDIKGHRIGYGKGYYDRFLNQLPHSYTVGISFEPPIETITPTPADVPLHACITPTHSYMCRPRD